MGKWTALARPAAIATYKVTVVYVNDGLNHTIDCADDQSNFDAAGTCSSCAGKLISGSVSQEAQSVWPSPPRTAPSKPMLRRRSIEA